MKIDLIEETVVVPEGVKVRVENKNIIVEGQKGRIERKFLSPKVQIELKDGIKIVAKKATKREKTIVGTYKSHIKNMIIGAESGFEYKLKICSGHFPMSVSVKNSEFIVKNFFGEKIPRVFKLKQGVDVKVQGDIILVSSVDKELAGQTAASIEQLTRRTKYDHRIFQDGIYITSKAGKELK